MDCFAPLAMTVLAPPIVLPQSLKLRNSSRCRPMALPSPIPICSPTITATERGNGTAATQARRVNAAGLHPHRRVALSRRLATGPLRHDAPVPFFHFYGGKMQKDVLGA